MPPCLDRMVTPAIAYGNSLQRIWLQAPELKARTSAFLSALPPTPPSSPGQKGAAGAAGAVGAVTHHQPPSSKPPSAAHVQAERNLHLAATQAEHRKACRVAASPGTPGIRTLRGRAWRAAPASTPGTPGMPGVQSNGRVPNPKHMC